MSTVTYQEAMEELGVSWPTVHRRLQITGVPVSEENGLHRFDLEALQDAWAGHREAVLAEKASREKKAGAPLSVLVPKSMREELDELAAMRDVSLATIVRETLRSGLANRASR